MNEPSKNNLEPNPTIENKNETSLRLTQGKEFSQKRKRRTAAEIARGYTCPVPDCLKAYG